MITILAQAGKMIYIIIPLAAYHKYPSGSLINLRNI